MIGMTDTGIDYDHCFFRDESRDVPFDRLDPLHRKIVTYDTSLGDAQDYYHGHGTHCVRPLPRSRFPFSQC